MARRGLGSSAHYALPTDAATRLARRSVDAAAEDQEVDGFEDGRGRGFLLGGLAHAGEAGFELRIGDEGEGREGALFDAVVVGAQAGIDFLLERVERDEAKAAGREGGAHGADGREPGFV